MSPSPGTVWRIFEPLGESCSADWAGEAWGSSSNMRFLSLHSRLVSVNKQFLYSPITTGWYSISAKVPTPWWTVFFHLWARKNSPQCCICHLYSHTEKKKINNKDQNVYQVTDTESLLSSIGFAVKCFYIYLIFHDLIDDIIFTNVCCSVLWLIELFSMTSQSRAYFWLE